MLNRIPTFAFCLAVLALASVISLTTPRSSAAAESRRHWKQIEVPGAVCGDGSPYHVLVEKRDPTKWVIALNQGGACWNFATCIGPTPLTWIHPWPEVTNLGGLASTDPEKSPVHDYSMVYFPYCTGDIHVGDHIAQYHGVTVHHRGKRNIEDGIRMLEEKNILRFGKIKELMLYGPSAGALGVLHHATWLDRKLPPDALRTLIADAPGLHFSNAIWNRFSPEFLKDFHAAMEPLAYDVSFDADSFMPLAGLVPAACRALPDWNLGFLQGTRDIVMSAIFGGIDPWEHERRVLGPYGLAAMTAKPDDNCASWIPRSEMHTFLFTNASSFEILAGGIDAMDFIAQLHFRKSTASYR